MNKINEIISMPEVHEPQPVTLGQKIRALRMQQRMSKSEVTRRTGVSMYTLRLIEADQTREPKIDTLSRILDVLGYEIQLVVVEKGQGEDVQNLPGDNQTA